MGKNPLLNTKAIIAINIIDNKVLYYKSQMSAQRLDGFFQRSISNCCSGKINSYKGYKWFYATDLLGVMNYLYKGGVSIE